MDDSNKPSPYNNQPQTPIGMSAFGPTEREQFGQYVRLAMACIESSMLMGGYYRVVQPMTLSSMQTSQQITFVTFHA